MGDAVPEEHRNLAGGFNHRYPVWVDAPRSGRWNPGLCPEDHLRLPQFGNSIRHNA